MTPQEQDKKIQELETKVKELSDFVKQITSPATFPTTMEAVLVSRGFLKYTDKIVVTNPSGKEFFYLITDFKENRAIISSEPLYNLKATTVDYTNDTFTTVAHGLQGSEQLYFQSSEGTIPSPLVYGATYYPVNITTNTFKLSLTFGGAPINITDNGSGIIYYSLE